jgi:hypothetical protein
MQVELNEIKDLKITTAGGKTVEIKEAMEKLKDGGVVVMSNDGKAVDPGFLRILKDDILVLSSPELVTGGVSSSFGTGVIRIQGGGPGGIQIQPLPAVIPPAAPAVDPVAPAPAPANPAPAVKPAIGRVQIAPIAPAPPVEVEKK